MNWLYACIIALSMYSRLPLPPVEWTQERMKHALCFFPLVGVIEGMCLSGWLYLSHHVLGCSAVFAALTGTAVPFLVTGGIHMDGFMDTVDAVHSYADRQKRLEILKDPHTGAFAVIWAGVYLLLYAAFLHEYVLLAARRAEILYYLLPPCFLASERALSGLSVICLPKAKKDGLAASFARTAEKGTDRLLMLLWLFVPFAGILPVAGMRGILAVLLLTAVQILLFVWYRHMAESRFGGVTGDLAGWYLQVCELLSLAAAVLLAGLGL